MVKRLFDIVCSGIASFILLPVFIIAAVLIKISSAGPVFYKTRRIGKDGREFTMLKFRTMHVNLNNHGGAITSFKDPRIFFIGAVLRFLKIDELPQLLNIIKGDMSIIGPRPEDPNIVHASYTKEQLETLKVRPGLASPGSIYNYTHAERLICAEDAERFYREKILPVKLALDIVYVRNASFFYDISIILRTLYVIAMKLFNRHLFPDPPELRLAHRMHLLLK